MNAMDGSLDKRPGGKEPPLVERQPICGRLGAELVCEPLVHMLEKGVPAVEAVGVGAAPATMSARLSPAELASLTSLSSLVTAEKAVLSV